MAMATSDKVQFKRSDKAKSLGLYSEIKASTPGSAGIDLFAMDDVILYNNNSLGNIQPVTEIRTGLYLWTGSNEDESDDFQLSQLLLPRGSSKFHLANTIGLIDSDYQGELIIRAINFSRDTIVIKEGSKVAQLILVPTLRIRPSYFIEVNDFETKTVRGEGRNNSTGDR